MENQNTTSLESSFPTLASKQAFLIGLFEKCPMHKDIETCPAYKLRDLPAAEKIEMVLRMNEIKLDELIAHHMECMKEKPH